MNDLLSKISELDYMQKDLPENIAKEKRSEPRRAKLRNYRIEIKLVGKPIYQFRVIDVTIKGAGLLIKDDSAFLKMIEVGQIVTADFISPKGTGPSGIFKVQIKHITNPDRQEYKGHQILGLSILKKLDN